MLAVEESKQRRDARFTVTAGTLPSQPSKALLWWQKRNYRTIPFLGDLRGDFLGEWTWIKNLFWDQDLFLFISLPIYFCQSR